MCVSLYDYAQWSQEGLNEGWVHLDVQWLSSAIDKLLCYCSGGLIYKHHRQPLVTNGLYNVTGLPQDIGGSRAPRLIKAHGKLHFLVLSPSSRLAEAGRLLQSWYFLLSFWHLHCLFCWLTRSDALVAE